MNCRGRFFIVSFSRALTILTFPSSLVVALLFFFRVFTGPYANLWYIAISILYRFGTCLNLSFDLPGGGLLLYTLPQMSIFLRVDYITTRYLL